MLYQLDLYKWEGYIGKWATLLWCVYVFVYIKFFFFLAEVCSGLMWDLSSQTRDWTRATVGKGPNPNHETTRELTWYIFKSRLDDSELGMVWKWWLNLGWRCSPKYLLSLPSSSPQKKFYLIASWIKAVSENEQIHKLGFYLFYIKLVSY